MMSASVRGIGVADMTSTCGEPPFAESAARCATPEPMLLIRDNGTQPMKLHTLLNERVCAHDNLRRAGLDGGQCRTFLRGSHRAGEQRARDAQLIQA